MKDTVAKIIAGLGLLVMLGLVMVGSMVLNGWVLVKLWTWFAIPLGMPALTLVEAIGVDLIVSFLTSHTSAPKKKTTEEALEELLQIVLKPFVFLGLGFLLKMFL